MIIIIFNDECNGNKKIIVLTHRKTISFQELADMDGFYSMRTICTTADNKETEFLSSVKAQAFLESGLSDVINAWILPNGAVMAVSFQVNNSSQYMTEGRNNYDIHSNFYLRYVEQAPV